jgi:hypothetical protein
LLARVTSIDLLVSEGGQPVGYALAGPAGVAVGPHAFLTCAAIGALAACPAASAAGPPLTRQVITGRR